MTSINVKDVESLSVEHEFRYERSGDSEKAAIRIRRRGMSNHEVREVMVGLWASLDDDDKADHIRELQHYFSDPDAFLSPLAQAISKCLKGASS